MINLSMENFVQYSPMAYDLVSHTLTLGFAVMIAALLYFVLTIRTVAPRYRISSVLSVVVMVSAFLILLAQQQSWANAFVYDTTSGYYVSSFVLSSQDAIAGVGSANPSLAFTNGFRYLNWLIDVPMLLFQILFVIEISKQDFARTRNIFFVAGALMIITGYIGQFYEVGNSGPFLVWGAISTVFFVIVLIQMNGLLQKARKNMSAAAGGWLNSIWLLFLVSWMLYPGAYLAPLLLDGAATLLNPAEAGSVSEIAVVARQITFTIADITSKVIYGVMLTVVAQIRSEEDGYSYEQSEMTSAPAVGD